jgi:hypothetical protein
VWSEQPLENVLQSRLRTLPEPARTNLPADYSTARRFVVEEIAGHIGTTEPDLTDHSDHHLADVMERAVKLIGDKTEYFSPHELYLLGVTILFHDVGNLHGRKEHHKKIAGVYDDLRKREARFKTERTAVLAIAGAHTGSAKDGSIDALRDVGSLSFQANSVRAQQIAAVLRFADELAEGPQRTSAYLQNHQMYKPDSRVFHEYANVTDYCIDRGAERIAASYNIDITLVSSELQVGQGVPLSELLQFSYARIVKLDQERRYCKHYCDLLSAFKETAVAFNFYLEGQQLDIGIPPLVISDLIVPGEPAKDLEQIDARYAISAILDGLKSVCGGGS